MKTGWVSAGLWILMIGSGLAAMESFHLVEIGDIDGKMTCKVLTGAELKTLQKDIQNESRLYSKAISAAAKEWTESETSDHKPFPRGAIGRRTAVVKGTFSDKAKAEEKQSDYQDRSAEKIRRDTVREKERDQKSDRSKELRIKDKAKADRRAADDERARTLYRKHLEVLSQAESAAAEEAPAAEPAK